MNTAFSSIFMTGCSPKGIAKMHRRSFLVVPVLLGFLFLGGPEAAGQLNTARLGSPGAWDPAVLEVLQKLDPKWAHDYGKIATSSWDSGVLPRKTVELISIGLSAASTNLNPEGTRRHIRAALEAGATREEILVVLKAAAILAIHSASLGAPMLLEEARAAGVTPAKSLNRPATPGSDQMKAAGQWNKAWDPFDELDPAWTDSIIAAGAGIYLGGVLSPKDAEFLSIALDASVTHMYGPGTRRHIKAALKAGATMEEVMEVLKLCVAQGAQSINLGLPILMEELAQRPEENRGARAVGSTPVAK